MANNGVDEKSISDGPVLGSDELEHLEIIRQGYVNKINLVKA